MRGGRHFKPYLTFSLCPVLSPFCRRVCVIDSVFQQASGPWRLIGVIISKHVIHQHLTNPHLTQTQLLLRLLCFTPDEICDLTTQIFSSMCFIPTWSLIQSCHLLNWGEQNPTIKCILTVKFLCRLYLQMKLQTFSTTLLMWHQVLNMTPTLFRTCRTLRINNSPNLLCWLNPDQVRSVASTLTVNSN